MEFKEKILNQINKEVYGSTVIEISYLIYQYISVGRQNIQFINLGILRNHITQEYSDYDILLTARVLSILRHPVLDECYELIDNEVAVLIPREEIYLALKEQGQLFHPDTGKEVFDFRSKITVFYKPNQKFLADLEYQK